MCITSVSFSILQDDKKMGPIVLGRSIHQGCPLLPYIFIIYTEGLSTLLHHKETQGGIHGCKVARGAPLISHLFFINVNLFFFKANEVECRHLQHCLALYAHASGQEINFEKSFISFSHNTPRARALIRSIIPVEERSYVSSYLGLSSSVGRNRKEVFLFVKDRIWSRL